MASIQIVSYDPSWPKLYQREKVKILQAGETWIRAIEHVGSTAVPNLPAKPTIDICIGVENLKSATDFLVPAITSMKYEYLPQYEQSIPDRRYLQYLNDNGEHLFHIHIVVFNERLWNEYLNFRNYLISHPDDAEKYATIKIALKNKFEHDRVAYTEGKSDFIRKIFEKF